MLMKQGYDAIEGDSVHVVPTTIHISGGGNDGDLMGRSPSSPRNGQWWWVPSAALAILFVVVVCAFSVHSYIENQLEEMRMDMKMMEFELDSLKQQQERSVPSREEYQSLRLEFETWKDTSRSKYGTLERDVETDVAIKSDFEDLKRDYDAWKEESTSKFVALEDSVKKHNKNNNNDYSTISPVEFKALSDMLDTLKRNYETDKGNSTSRLETLEHNVNLLEKNLDVVKNNSTPPAEFRALLHDVDTLKNNHTALLSSSQSKAMRICSGRTDSSSWVEYGNGGLTRIVLTSHCGFTSTPNYVTSISGLYNHWTLTGTSAVYNPTKDTFEIYLLHPQQANSQYLQYLTKAQASEYQWSVEWIGIEMY